MQFKQDETSVLTPNFPGTQAVQMVLPGFAVIYPTSHSEHDPAPGWDENFPLSQILQEEALSLNFPASQAVHIVLPVAVVM